MNDREILLNSIFFPRPSYKGKDEKDHRIEVENDIHVAARFFLKDKNMYLDVSMKGIDLTKSFSTSYLLKKILC